MPRSNRPRGKRPDRDDDNERDLNRTLYGHRTTVAKRDGLWNVQPLAGSSAVKQYTCPGCGLSIRPGIAHTVAWRADGIFGEEDDVAARRHWHTHCWRIKA
ncbi:MAG TPA: hypothetical protein VGP24_12005 [Glaciihabitans sp.]|jgi:hypothetical protein|nr:hypothetical protein [Glaciihabitans sp.]